MMWEGLSPAPAPSTTCQLINRFLTNTIAESGFACGVPQDLSRLPAPLAPVR